MRETHCKSYRYVKSAVSYYMGARPLLKYSMKGPPSSADMATGGPVASLCISVLEQQRRYNDLLVRLYWAVSHSLVEAQSSDTITRILCPQRLLERISRQPWSP